MIKPITIVVFVFTFVYIAYIIFEHFYYRFLRKKLKKIIHVNGIRGKSTVTRLIDAGLRECGIKVASKTTGTIPIYINKNNQEVKINRLGPANIREQLRTIRRAVKEEVDYLVLECMAVNPELQNICEHKILNSDITVITNVRYDHLDVMGNSLESIATSLVNTTPENGILVLGKNNEDQDLIQNVFEKSCLNQHAKFVNAIDYTGEELLDTFKENIEVALTVAKELGLDQNTFFEGMKKYIHDPGALTLSIIDESCFINGFSINDPDSILEVYDSLEIIFKEKLTSINKKDISILLNERGDRIFRTNQHIQMLEKMEYKNVYICGDNTNYIQKELSKKGITSKIINSVEEIKHENIIFGCGNIKGLGFKIINYYQNNSEGGNQ